MHSGTAKRYSLADYADPLNPPPVFRLTGKPGFSPVDLNISFLAKGGWSPSVDRLRFHFERPASFSPSHPLVHTHSKPWAVCSACTVST